jgi:hypothetical protein
MRRGAMNNQYHAPKVKKREILGFYGRDKSAAWAKAIELAEELENAGATWKMGVRAEFQHVPRRQPEWVVVLLHYDTEK